MVRSYLTGTGARRWEGKVWWIKDPCNAEKLPLKDRVVKAAEYYAPATDPANIRRVLPTVRPHAEVAPGGEAAPPGPPPAPNPPFIGWEFSGKGKRPVVPGPRVPPTRRERESKVITRSVQIGLGLQKALDGISENAEIVDSFFSALPPDVQKRWNDKAERRGLTDNAGQYGIDGADWKLQALWYNWEKVDVSKALVGIVGNTLEDEAFGKLYRGIREGGIRQPI